MHLLSDTCSEVEESILNPKPETRSQLFLEKCVPPSSSGHEASARKPAEAYLGLRV